MKYIRFKFPKFKNGMIQEQVLDFLAPAVLTHPENPDFIFFQNIIDPNAPGAREKFETFNQKIFSMLSAQIKNESPERQSWQAYLEWISQFRTGPVVVDWDCTITQIEQILSDGYIGLYRKRN